MEGPYLTYIYTLLIPLFLCKALRSLFPKRTYNVPEKHSGPNSYIGPLAEHSCVTAREIHSLRHIPMRRSEQSIRSVSCMVQDVILPLRYIQKKNRMRQARYKQALQHVQRKETRRESPLTIVNMTERVESEGEK